MFVGWQCNPAGYVVFCRVVCHVSFRCWFGDVLGGDGEHGSNTFGRTGSQPTLLFSLASAAATAVAAAVHFWPLAGSGNARD
jgi:hypothetical protein